MTFVKRVAEIMKMKLILQVILVACCMCQIHSASVARSQDQAFVLTALNNDDALMKRHKRSVEKTAISSLHVTSVVMSRFTRVTVVSEMENHLNESKDMTFSVRLPDAAFITEFQMEVSGVTFVGKVKEKETAKKQFEQAVQKGNTAGLVTADVRETQTFNVQANVAAESSVTFTLVYQELLKRRLGEYNHVILINPGQVVSDLVVDVYITEKPEITSLNVRLPNSNNNVRGKNGGYSEIPINYDIRRSKHQAKISFKPSESQQRQLMLIPEDERKLTVRYDVTREVLGGEIQTRNGYFVHFFAPENLPIFPKNVVFVIDRSGSMWGTKMEQTKKAFTSVLKEMRETDRFNIISFAGGITVWNSEKNLVTVDKENVEDAIDYVKKIRATGSTNINDAMIRATELLGSRQSKSSMIILLTDGDPTAGVTNTAQIRLNVKKAVGGRFSVFCLGFGKYLNHKFLKKMASENDGISRQIYEDSDADLQLEGFFQEVATPLLLNFYIKYRGSEVQNVTKSKFDKYFSGSEVVVVGQVINNSKHLSSVVKGESFEGRVAFKVKNTPQDDSFQHWFKDTGDFDDFIERMWAYYTIKELLQQKDVSDSSEERNKLNDRILNLALEYSFVTPLTSMVVTLPEDEITTASPTGSTIHPPLPPCFLRGAKLPHYLTYPPIWCPYVLSEEEVQAQSNSQPMYSPYSSYGQTAARSLYIPPAQGLVSGMSGGMARRRYRPGRPAPRPVAYALYASQTTRAPKRRLTYTTTTIFPTSVYTARSRTTGPPQSTYPTTPPTTTVQSTSTTFPTSVFTTRSKTPGHPQTIYTTTPTTTTGQSTTPSTLPVWFNTPIVTTGTTTAEMPAACNKNLTESRGRIESLRDVNNKTVCEWVIILNKGSWINIHLEKIDTRSNKVEISSDVAPVYSHMYGSSPEKYLLLRSNNARIRMEIFPGDNDRNPIIVSYEEYIPGGPKLGTTNLSSDFFNEEKANFTTNISSSVSQTGFIASPNYPMPYPSNSHSLWIFQNTDPTLELRIASLDMDIEMNGDGSCTHDKIVIMDGDNERDLCGYDLSNGSWSTTEANVKIAFLSDDKLETSGFKMKYEYASLLR